MQKLVEQERQKRIELQKKLACFIEKISNQGQC